MSSAERPDAVRTGPAIRLEQAPTFLAGTGLGFSQPITLGAMLVTASLPDAGQIHRTLSAGLGEIPAITAPSEGEHAGIALARWVVELATGLQRAAKIPVFDAPRLTGSTSTPDDGLRVTFAVPWIDAAAAGRALADTATAISECLAGRAGARERLERLSKALATRGVTGTNTMRFLRAAHLAAIPFHPLAGNTYAYGQGRHQRWMDSSFTDRTPSLGVKFARDKRQAARVLRDQGFPIPEHVGVASADEAVRVAQRLGFPVVVKPADKDGGIGVTAGLETAAAVAEAFELARKASRNVLVEKHVHGDDHRLTICHGRMIKAVRRIPGGVTGDGRSSIAALIDRINADPVRVRRNASRGRVLLSLDGEALSILGERGLGPAHVPADGEFIALRRRANISTGGEPVLVTPRVHPDNRLLAERAAAALKLDMAGVDLILPDIARSWLETGGGICEVNSQPQIGEATTPEIFAQILAELLPEARIPTAVVIGSSAEGAAAALASIARARGLACSTSSTEGAWDAQGRQLCPAGDAVANARAAIRDTDTRALIAVLDEHALLRGGLPDDRCAALVVEPAGRGRDMRDFERAMHLAAPNIAGTIVVPADAPEAEIALRCADRARVHLVAPRRDDATLAAHLAAGGTGSWAHADGAGTETRILQQAGAARAPRVVARISPGAASNAILRTLLAVAALAPMSPPRAPSLPTKTS